MVLRVVMVQDEEGDPEAAGAAAAQSLKEALQGIALKAVIVSECFEDEQNKQLLLKGVCRVFDQDLVYGSATYGSFTQQGCTDYDSVCLLGIGGEGVGVATALVTDLGTARLSFDEHEAEIKQRLRTAGEVLAKKLPGQEQDRLLIIMADAHSPKNQYLVEGVQRVRGEDFPITGGSANKNAGQTFVYYRGRMYRDSAVALLLSGNFRVAMSGRLANEQEAVIRSAREGATQAVQAAGGSPVAVLAYNCAGRRSKLDDMQDELDAIQVGIGTSVPLFGCYNAGEIGPLDASEKKSTALCGGSGWHVMFTAIWKD